MLRFITFAAVLTIVVIACGPTADVPTTAVPTTDVPALTSSEAIAVVQTMLTGQHYSRDIYAPEQRRVPGERYQRRSIGPEVIGSRVENCLHLYKLYASKWSATYVGSRVWEVTVSPRTPSLKTVWNVYEGSLVVNELSSGRSNPC